MGANVRSKRPTVATETSRPAAAAAAVAADADGAADGDFAHNLPPAADRIAQVRPFSERNAASLNFVHMVSRQPVA